MFKMEDEQNGRWPKWKMTKIEDNQNGRQPKSMTKKNILLTKQKGASV